MNKMCIRTLAIIALAASSALADDAFGQVAGSTRMAGNAGQAKSAQQGVVTIDGIVGEDGTIGMEEKDYVFLFGNVHRDTAVLRVLIQNAPDYFNAPDMPRFAIIGKERKFYLGIGGFAKASISYDFANPITNPLCFVTSSIPMENIPGNGALVQMNAGASNLFFNFIALPHTKNQIGAYINFDFSGNNANYGFSLKSAYLTYKGFTLGFKPSLFTDGAASAPTVDQQGPNAMTFLFNTVLNYQYAFNDHWKVGVGLEMPVVNATYNNYSYQVNQRVPDIPFYGQFSYKEGKAWIRLSGLIRNMYYRNVSEGSTEDVFGYGIKLSGTTLIGRKVKLFYQTVYGKGLGSYIQDLQGLGLDMVPAGYGGSGNTSDNSVSGPVSGDGGLNNSLELGTLESVEALGSYTGVMWQISPKFFTSATFSEVECFYPKAANDGSTAQPVAVTAPAAGTYGGGTYSSGTYGGNTYSSGTSGGGTIIAFGPATAPYTKATANNPAMANYAAQSDAVTKKMQSAPTYKRSKYFVANLFYNITPSVQAGVEYLWGSREDTDGTTHHNTRLQTAVRVNF